MTGIMQPSRATGMIFILYISQFYLVLHSLTGDNYWNFYWNHRYSKLPPNWLLDEKTGQVGTFSWKDKGLKSGTDLPKAGRGEDLVHYEKVEASLGGTFGFRQIADSPPIPTAVLLHGLAATYDSPCNQKIATGLLERGGHNIIVADYHKAVEGPGYDSATRNTEAIGKAIGDFLMRAQKDGTISLGSTTLVGFSLGAHVAGIAGYRIKESSGYLHRIIGLDPARPIFINLPLEKKLDSSDAGYVMIVHTAAGYLGIEEPIGHADFYPNGGKEIQPPCLGNGLSSLVCSHTASCSYLADSISRPMFVAEKCSSWEEYKRGMCRSNEKVAMGFDTDTSTQGIFFLRTGGEPPYGSPDVDFNTVDIMSDDASDDGVLSYYHFYPRSSSSIQTASTALLSTCLVVTRLFLKK